MYSAPPCVYKRRRRAPSQVISHPSTRPPLTHPLSGARYWHLPQSSPPLAETWELPSLSRLACTPLLQVLRCKIIQCIRTPLLDVRPRGRNQDKPCVTVYLLHQPSRIWDTQHRLLVGARPLGLDTDTSRVCFLSSLFKFPHFLLQLVCPYFFRVASN